MIGLAQQRLGNYAAAGVPIREAVVLRAQRRPNHPAYAETLSLLGLQLWFEGKLEAARDMSAQALSLAERTLRPDHPQIALALSDSVGLFLIRRRVDVAGVDAAGLGCRRAHIRSHALRDLGVCQRLAEAERRLATMWRPGGCSNARSRSPGRGLVRGTTGCHRGA